MSINLTHKLDAKVSNNGELFVALLRPNQLSTHNMSVINTPYVFAEPVAGKRMVMQNILLHADKNVDNEDALITIYTAATSDATTGDTIISFELQKRTNRDLLGLNLTLPSGVYVLATTNDNNIYATMMGYYEDDI